MSYRIDAKWRHVHKKAHVGYLRIRMLGPTPELLAGV